ncbi:MAG TPA: AbrB/MazE/SpoVT family DNA-binding domain-containing protein [Terriglobia bacterium]|nr:AbrB/MazE/SpoVT family DNA-binding domain-containing protein [Terriglobia bacterium]
MSKVTSKLQLTVPKAIADRYCIRPGDELEWVPAGDTIRVIPAGKTSAPRQLRSVEERSKLFREMIRRQRQREVDPQATQISPTRPLRAHERQRGWTREDLYTRGRSR